MNYYDARPIKDGSGWHYTCMNDGRIWPVGYDSPIQTCPECNGRSAHVTDNHPDGRNYCATCSSKGYVEVEPHPPHATQEEAYQCATNYVLDTATWDLRISTTHSVPRCDADGCGTLVEDGGGARWGFGIQSHSVLCGDHRNRDTLAAIVGTIGQVWSS